MTVDRSPQDSVARSDGEHGLYLYALAPARRIDLTGVVGIDGSCLDVQTYDDLAMVTSEVEFAALQVDESDLSETGALARLARRHDGVIRVAFEQVTVVPLRLGTIVPDQDAAAALVDRVRVDAHRLLAHLDGCREWGVQLLHAERPASPSAGARDQGPPQTLSGTAYLRSRRDALHAQETVRQRAAGLGERVRAILGEHAREIVRRRGPNSELIIDMAVLVEGSAEAAFLAAAENFANAADQVDGELRLTGPWPPYTFAHLELSVDGDG